MDIEPYTDDFAQAAEYLRLALALLTRHGIPPSPLNFRLGYDSVSGRRDTLRTAFADLEARSAPVPGDTLGAWYRREYVRDETVLNALRAEIRRILDQLQDDVADSGRGLSCYRETLQRFAETLDAADAPASLALAVNRVIDDTRATEAAQNRLERRVGDMAGELADLRAQLERVRQESLTDALTGIANRKAFDTILEQALRDAGGGREPFCLLLADIDHFKRFNDVHGHLVGDKVLRFVAGTLERSLDGSGSAARFGGEEFAVLLPGTALADAEAVAERIRRTVSAGPLLDKATSKSYGRITVSVGVAMARADDTPASLFQRVDKALYLAKEGGRNRIGRVA